MSGLASFLQVMIDGTKLSRQGKFGKGGCKKLDSLSVGRQPYWICHGSRICHGTENLISNDEKARIDFGADYQAVRAAEGN
jgi:hypothetical protein